MRGNSERRAVVRVAESLPFASRALATVLCFVLMIILSSCSVFATAKPPTSVAVAAEALRDSLHELGALSEVTVVVEPRDEKDGGSLDNPGAWLVFAHGDAHPSALEVRPLVAAIESRLDATRRLVGTVATVELAGDGLPNIGLQFDRSGSLEAVNSLAKAVSRLRTLTGTQAIRMAMGATRPSISVGTPAKWTDVVGQLRVLDGFSEGSLASVALNTARVTAGRYQSSSIAIDRSTPDVGTLAVLADAFNQPGVTWLSYDAVRPPDSLDNWRPKVTVDTGSRTSGAAVVNRLTHMDQTAAPIAGIPRAAFRVSSKDGDTEKDASGYVGLPLGAAEPRDLVPAPKRSSATEDPAAEAGRLAANLDLVKGLFDDAGNIVGIPGTQSISTTQCSTGTGMQVFGALVIPVFKVANRADTAYASVVASWKSQGYTSVDHALGTELRSGGPLKVLTIRGAPDGLEITATSKC